MPFKIQGRYFFLTYSQTDFDPQQYHDELIHRGIDIQQLIVARELHQDENPHIHVALSTKRRFTTTDPRFFDFNSCHPNVQRCRSWNAVKTYVEKDGNVTTFNSSSDSSTSLFEKARTLSKEEYYTFCLSRKIPFGYADHAWRTIHHPAPEASTLTTDFVPSGLLGLPELHYRTYDSTARKATILIGPTGIGKTTWATIHIPKPALLISHMDDLKLFSNQIHNGLIFDDMNFTHLPLQAQIHLVDFDQPRSIHVRYTCAHIPAETHKIFTCNHYPFTEHPAIARRCILIDLNT